MIIESLRKIHKEYRLMEGGVSSHTKSAQKIIKAWQAVVCSNIVEAEVKVSPHNNERIDVVDNRSHIAYELKVSGKNTHHEFYKDIAKVLTYNEYQETEFRIWKLVFISEVRGINSLKRRLDTKFISMLERVHNLSIELVCI
jgi:hypothetical protein